MVCRIESIAGRVIGREGALVLPKTYAGESLAIFTSGGDSQGMNSAIRSAARMGLYLGCRVFFIHEGYQGMVDGGNCIREASWNSVSDIVQRGGTIIGSARCKEFRERPGRLKACLNLLQHNITNLVCIGGDGSLTGANLFRQEWPSLVQELADTGKVAKNKIHECSSINIVGLVGSIDNDFCGTDMTIGTDSAAHRIIEALDAVMATAHSHQRAFVVEVMGRRCGYLAVVAGMATDADFVFAPEMAPPPKWQDVMCEKLSQVRNSGERVNIVIVAEGAVDCEGTPITVNQVKQTIVERLKFDTRVTVLGHVQRGGAPSAFDRLLGCRMGAESVLALMEMTPSDEPCVISTVGNQMVRVPLMQSVLRTQQVQKAMDEKNFSQAVALRGRSFARNVETYRLLSRMRPPVEKDNLSGGRVFNLAVMNVGAPACGVNAALRAFVRVGIYHNCRVFTIQNSFEGLANGEFKEMKWTDVGGWVIQGGSLIGCRKELPSDMQRITEQLEKHKIHGLLIIGGFEAFNSAVMLEEAREEYAALRIPICVIPATISNNVPGASLSIGADTALNEICAAIDKIKQSATGTKRRVFIIETMGGYCGYLATLSALASGADNAYIFEEKFRVEDIKDDVRVISRKMDIGAQRYIIMRCERASDNYTTKFITQLFSEESNGAFETKVNVLGHVQQGGSPSPFDRNMATKMAVKSVEWLLKQINKNLVPNPENCPAAALDPNVDAKLPESVALLGLVQRDLTFSPVSELKKGADFKHRLPKEQWWLKMRPLLRILAKHDSIYAPETFKNADEAPPSSSTE